MKREIYFKILSRLTLLLCGVLLSAQLCAQGITVQFRGSVQQAIEMLQKRYNYSVVIKTEGVDLSKNVILNVKNSTINNVVAEIFKGQNVSCAVNGRNILVSGKEAEEVSAATRSEKIAVKGRITDDKGKPIMGAVVYDKQSQKGVVSDVSGNYAIEVADESQLVISFLGYDDKSVNVNRQSQIDVTMNEKVSNIDEVIVVGYGTQKKSDLTGSVAQVNMTTLDTKQAVSLADYLRGSVAGLNISRSASTSGQTNFEVRGQTTINSSNSKPLLVVDGMIFSGMLNEINPSDVATISVMKDASSAAVYGASAASGVIIITTKEGKGDKPTIRFDVKTSLSKLYNKPEAYDVSGYMGMRADALTGEGGINASYPEFYTNPYKLQGVSLDTWLGYEGQINPNIDPTDLWLDRLKLKPEEKQNYYGYKSVDWLDKVFRTGVVQDYNLSVSGKSKDLSYYWSLGMLDNMGVVYNDRYKNIRSHINISNKITDFLEVGIRGNLSNTNADGESADWSKAYDNSPLGNVTNSDGTYVRYPNSDNMARNPLDKVQWDDYDRNLHLIGVVFAKVTLPLGFKLESSYNNRWRFQSNNFFKPSWTIDGADSNGVAQRKEYKQYDWSIENILRWNKTIGDIHKFDVVLMQSAAKFISSETTAGATGFSTSELLGWHSLKLSDIQLAESTDQVDTKASYMARVNYSLKDKYYLTLTIRRDGYSAFGQNNPWADFPAAALAWRLSEEEFIKKYDWISNLKLRLSYGKNGNSNMGRYQALSTLGNDYYLSNGQNIVTMYPTTMGNRLMQWEETLSTNIGVDFAVLNNRINLTADIYHMKTTNLLMDRQLPTLTGFKSVMSNMGQLDNKGLEITINSVNFNNNKFRWTSDLIFSMNRNKIKHLYGDMVDVLDADGNVIGRKEADDPTNGRYIGHSIDEIYDYKINGVWQLHEAAEAAALGYAPGDYKTYLAPGSTGYSSADYLWQGFKKPRYRISLNNSFTLFNDFNISFMLRSEFGHVKKNNEIVVGSYADRTSQMKLPYWTPENQSNTWGKLGASKKGDIYRNASFVRIENVTVSYNLPTRWISKAAMQSARVFFNVDNAYCFDNWLYWDPETSAPTPTTFTFGISVTL